MTPYHSVEHSFAISSDSNEGIALVAIGEPVDRPDYEAYFIVFSVQIELGKGWLIVSAIFQIESRDL